MSPSAVPLIAIGLSLATPGLYGGSPAAQQPAFRGGVDLIAVDVQVIDGGGRPIAEIDRSGFEVTIDGRKRRVVSADLIEEARGASVARPRTSGQAPVVSPASPAAGAPGRTLVLAIDAGSFEAGAALAVARAAREFIDRLQPSDRLGLFTVPFGPRVVPTIDHAAIRRAMDAVTGQRQSVPGQFNLSASEIIDITAQTAGLASPSQALPQATARGTPPPLFSDIDTLQRVQLRECRSSTDLGCLQSIVGEAAALAQYLQERAILSLNGITALLDALSRYPGRKTVVVLSGGMSVSDRPGGGVDIGDEAKTLGERAAHANAVVYAVHVDSGVSQGFAAESRRVRDSSSFARDRRIASRLLDEFAGASGGALLSATGAGEIALDRVLRETSAYYLLGVEPADMDRDGRLHRLRVRVSVRNATVRSRQWVVLRPPRG